LLCDLVALRLPIGPLTITGSTDDLNRCWSTPLRSG
jgi:hypothetical protein